MTNRTRLAPFVFPLALLLAACGGGGGSTPPPVGGPGGGPVGGPGGGPVGGPGGGPVGTPGTFASTYFLDGTETLNGAGDWVTYGFTLGGTRSLVFRLSTNYAVQAAIIEPDQLGAFTSGAAYSGYASFNLQDGFEPVTLGQGAYYVAVRNASSGANNVRFELDYAASLSTGTFLGANNATATELTPGQRRWDPFSIQSGVRYWIDGCNSGLNAFVIDATELSAFQSGGTFLQYSDYGGANSPDLYGGTELQLAPGSYYLVQSNPTSVPQSVNYVIQRWSSTATLVAAAELVERDTLDTPTSMPALELPPNGEHVRPWHFAGSACGFVDPAARLEVRRSELAATRSLTIGLAQAEPNGLALLVAGAPAAAPLTLDRDAGCQLVPSADIVIAVPADAAGRAEVTLTEAHMLAVLAQDLRVQWVLPPTAGESPRQLRLSEAGMLRR